MTTSAAARFTVPEACRHGIAARAASRKSRILPRGLDGVLRLRGDPPPHVPAPSGLRKAHVSLRLHGTRLSARCAQIHCRSWTGEDVYLKPGSILTA